MITYKNKSLAFRPLYQEGMIKIINPFIYRRIILSIRLRNNWSNIVESEIFEISNPEKIIPKNYSEKYTLKYAILLISYENDFIKFLQKKRNHIIKKVNSFFKFNAIEDINFLKKEKKNFSRKYF